MKLQSNEATKELANDIFSDEVSKHTKGEWKLANSGSTYESNKGYETGIIGGASGIDVLMCLGFIWGRTKEESKANAKIICKAVNLFPELIEALAYIGNLKSNLQDIASSVMKGIDNEESANKLYDIAASIYKESNTVLMKAESYPIN